MAENIMRRVYHNVTNLSACVSVFFHAQVVGMLFLPDFSPHLSLLAVNIETNVSVTIPLTNVILGLVRVSLRFHVRHLTHLQPNFIKCIIQQNCLYIVHQMPSCVCLVFRCDIRALPWGDSPRKTDGLFLDEPVLVRPSEAMLADLRPVPCQLLSPAGLAALYVKYPEWYADPTTTTVMFQPDIFTTFTPSQTSDLVLLGEVRSARPSPFCTASGNYMLLWLDQGMEEEHDGHPKLHLVHFVKDPVSIQVRPLEMPFFVDAQLDGIHSMAVDDHLGVVYLSHERGYIFAVPYA
jgi:hypothetical protein